jgi:hypothetical protein
MRILFALAVLVAAGCHVPDYGSGDLQCSPSGECPAGFHCASDQHCWLDGSGPSTGGEDLSMATASDLAGLVLDLAGADLGPAPARCSGSSALLCESFETPLLLAGWSQSAHNGSVSIDTSRAFRGKSSLRSSIQASALNTSPYATVNQSKIFPILGTLYARVWVYFPSPLSAQFEQFLNFTDSGGTGLSLATDTGAVTLNDYAGGVYVMSMTKLPLDRWVCVQFDMVQGATTGAMHVTIDGKLLSDLPPVAPTPTAVNLILGVDFNSNNAAIPAYDAWFDELIVDNKPISCAD